nr:pilus assembly protein PilM [Demequina litorisediminis]
MATRQVAIDIGETAVRVAEVELKGGSDPRDGASITAFAERAVPAGVIRNGEIEEPGAFAEVVKQTVAAAKVSAKSAAVNIGHPTVVLREVDVPAQPMDQIRKSLAFHVRDSLPMAVDDALLDFYPTAEFAGEQGQMLRGMLVAAPRELVRGVISSLQGSGVHLSRVDHTGFALWRGVCKGELTQSTVAIVNVGAAITTVVVSQRGAPRLVRVLGQGGNDVSKAVRSAYKGSTVDAEQPEVPVRHEPLCARGTASDRRRREPRDGPAHRVDSQHAGVLRELQPRRRRGAARPHRWQRVPPGVRPGTVQRHPSPGHDRRPARRRGHQQEGGPDPGARTRSRARHRRGSCDGSRVMNPVDKKIGAPALPAVNLIPQEIAEATKMRAVKMTALFAVLIAVGVMVGAYVLALGAKQAREERARRRDHRPDHRDRKP